MTNSITSERLRRGVARFHKGFPDEAKAYANVGRNHPDYGLSPQDHEAMKLARAQGWGAPQNAFDAIEHIKGLADEWEHTNTGDSGNTATTTFPTFSEEELAALNAEMSQYLSELKAPITEKAKTLVDEHGVELFVPGSNGTVDMSEESSTDE